MVILIPVCRVYSAGQIIRFSQCYFTDQKKKILIIRKDLWKFTSLIYSIVFLSTMTINSDQFQYWFALN